MNEHFKFQIYRDKQSVLVARTWARQQRTQPLFAGVESDLDIELRHKTIIERFGHLPHRDEILGRGSSADELTFLSEPGSSL